MTLSNGKRNLKRILISFPLCPLSLYLMGALHLYCNLTTVLAENKNFHNLKCEIDVQFSTFKNDIIDRN